MTEYERETEEMIKETEELKGFMLKVYSTVLFLGCFLLFLFI